jgi:hypothetical protein
VALWGEGALPEGRVGGAARKKEHPTNDNTAIEHEKPKSIRFRTRTKALAGMTFSTKIYFFFHFVPPGVS